MLKNQPRFKIYLLIFDLFLLLLSFFIAICVMPGNCYEFLGKTPGPILNCLASYLIFSFIIALTFFFNNLYKRNIITTVYRQFILILKSLILGIVFCLLLLFFFNLEFLTSYRKTIFFNFFRLILCFGVLSPLF